MSNTRSEFDRQLRVELDMAAAEAEAASVDLNRELSKVLGDALAGRAVDLPKRGPLYTDEERLAYYRAHGLDRCDDYPGGDAAFEADVLSGRYHDEEGVMDEPPKEDTYILTKMEDGTFAFDVWFSHYGNNTEILRVYNERFRQTRSGMIIM